MDDVLSDIIITDEFPVLAKGTRADERTRVLKQGETFAVFDRFGDVPGGAGEYGLYHAGTRHLSRWELQIGGQQPLLLSSTVRKAPPFLTADFTTPDVPGPGGITLLAKGQLHVHRRKFLWDGVCHESLRVSNFGLADIRTTVRIFFDADFADIFEVRGTVRARRGERRAPRPAIDSCTLRYTGLDGVSRQTIVRGDAAAHIEAGSLTLPVELAPGGVVLFDLSVQCASAAGVTAPPPYASAANEAARHQRELCRHQCTVSTSNEAFNEWIGRSSADLAMMTTERDDGRYPYAGVPWFSTPFGRDGIITALELLWVDPALARGVLSNLAATQAWAFDEANDAEPGKIIHEMRDGEMAACGEVPFGRYYGSVDSTPLFVMLAGAYFDRTADLDTIRAIWPHIEQANQWMDRYGDADGDGLIEYYRRSANGLVNQGWKDSHDAVSHADGTLADGPIALCEVQGYAYAARKAAGRLAAALGREGDWLALDRRAEETRAAFERQFWLEDLGTYALALDGQKQPCRVRASNAGQCLYTGIATVPRGLRVCDTLNGPALYSGWGVRTLGQSEVRFNPMSYHNGSVWPHDNALIAAGAARYGCKGLALRILGDLFEASSFLELRRIPELFCGFDRREGEGPTLYPVACLPQAWAAGSVFMLLQAALGLELDAVGRAVTFNDPVLPEWITWLRLEGVTVGDASVDLLCERHPHDVGISVLKRHGDVRVIHQT